MSTNGEDDHSVLVKGGSGQAALVVLDSKGDRSHQIAFYDLETTIPPTDVIEFGAVVLDKAGFYEVETYSTLIHSNR